ncbi:hypothetical protein GF389_01055 [Candidatus Dojkabacteria bacterium]|nr:hypothetical protein [Candidatus Dojkabacteria bacterium]
MSIVKKDTNKDSLITEPLSIEYLRSCLDGNDIKPQDSTIEQYLIEYGLLTSSKQITNKGRVLLENYPNKSFIVLLFSEDSFPWLKADQSYLNFEGGQILLVTDNNEKLNHALFLADLGIAKKNNSDEYIIIDRYTINFLNRFERNYPSNDMLYEVGEVGPNTSITVEKGATFNLTQVRGDMKGNLSQTGTITNSNVGISQDNKTESR